MIKAVKRVLFMVDRTTGRLLREGVKENEVSAEEACRILYDDDHEMQTGVNIVCDTDADRQLLADTYYGLYANTFNEKHMLEPGPSDVHAAYPAEMDVFQVDNMVFFLTAGIYNLDPSYAYVSTHGTVFDFHLTEICKTAAIRSPNIASKNLQMVDQKIVCMHKQKYHPSYEEAKRHLARVWSEYQQFFQEAVPALDYDSICRVNRKFAYSRYKK